MAHPGLMGKDVKILPYRDEAGRDRGGIAQQAMFVYVKSILGMIFTLKKKEQWSLYS